MISVAPSDDACALDECESLLSFLSRKSISLANLHSVVFAHARRIVIFVHCVHNAFERRSLVPLACNATLVGWRCQTVVLDTAKNGYFP